MVTVKLNGTDKMVMLKDGVVNRNGSFCAINSTVLDIDFLTEGRMNLSFLHDEKSKFLGAIEVHVNVRDANNDTGKP